MLGLFLSILLLVVLAALVIRFYPPLGAASTNRLQREDSGAREDSSHYEKGQFLNQLPTSMVASPATMFSIVVEMLKGSPARRPKPPLTVVRLEPEQLADAWKPKAVWFGHSALLLQMDGLTLLLDPMLGRAPSPFPMIGGKRYSTGLPIQPEELPEIDLVLLSHDHYDHLDYGTIRKLKDRVKRFVAPLGVGAHLVRWGVPADRITEADWWEELEVEGLRLVCTPARHFSGRNVTGRNGTLWCSWVIDGREVKVFFSGDSGYGPHFREIGRRYGPFDMTMIECGQYDPRWADIHMQPEESVQAHLDVGGRQMLPIHWGAFTLALHDWFEPAERALAAARLRGAEMLIPRIGQLIEIGGHASQASSCWWRQEAGWRAASGYLDPLAETKE